MPQGNSAERFCLLYGAQNHSVAFVQWSTKSAQRCIFKQLYHSFRMWWDRLQLHSLPEWWQWVRHRCKWKHVKISYKSTITCGLSSDGLRLFVTIKWNHNCVLPLHCVLGPFLDSCTYLPKAFIVWRLRSVFTQNIHWNTSEDTILYLILLCIVVHYSLLYIFIIFIYIHYGLLLWHVLGHSIMSVLICRSLFCFSDEFWLMHLSTQS